VAAFSARNRGTEYIKSPEMLTVSNALQKSRATYDRRKHQGAGRPSDVWSVGCMLYELVTSHFLFYDPDWIRFFVRLTQPEQQLLPDERMAQVEGLAVVREFTEYTLVRARLSVNPPRVICFDM
jgi:serine/threonine protein kinase